MAIGDSIPYNSPDDCRGCTGFVDRYATLLSTAIDRPVTVRNLSDHTGLTLPRLLARLDSLAPHLSAADIIIVAIAHNSPELIADAPCGVPIDEIEIPDFGAITEECVLRSTEESRAMFESLFGDIVAMRNGKPTIFRTVNRYNDWIGNRWPGWDGVVGPEEELVTKMVFDHWNEMLCQVADNTGFLCADIYVEFNGADGLSPAGELLAADHVHPSDRGNEVIAQVLGDLGFATLD